MSICCRREAFSRSTRKPVPHEQIRHPSLLLLRFHWRQHTTSDHAAPGAEPEAPRRLPDHCPVHPSLGSRRCREPGWEEGMMGTGGSPSLPSRPWARPGAERAGEKVSRCAVGSAQGLGLHSRPCLLPVSRFLVGSCLLHQFAGDTPVVRLSRE